MYVCYVWVGVVCVDLSHMWGTICVNAGGGGLGSMRVVCVR